MTRTCEISDDNCLAPAGYQIGGTGGMIGDNHMHGTKATCFACGLPVCTACSRRRLWFSFGYRRICKHCDEDEQVWRLS